MTGYLEIVDEWPSRISRAGHVPGAWDCPCSPGVRTEADRGLRTVSHREFEDSEHFPWHYTELGVVCACGEAMDADENCLSLTRGGAL